MRSVLRSISTGFAIIGGIALFFLCAVTVVGVLWRYGLNDPIFGIEDVSAMSLTLIVAASVAYGAHEAAHVSVNVIVGIFGRSVTRVTDVAARGLGVAICGYACYGLATKGVCGMRCGAMTSNLGLIHTPYYYVLSAAMGFTALLLATQLAAGLAHWNGADPNEIAD